MVRLPVWFESLRERLWVIPAIAAIAAGILAWALVRLDHVVGPSTDGAFFFAGGPESARLILSTIAAAMLSFTGLVFTVTMLVLQLASSQFSPRVTRTFVRDRGNQLVLGIFVATFVYALLVLRDIRSTEGDVFVPSIAVWWAFALLILSVGAFVYYIDHMAHAMRVTTIIASVAGETRAAIDRCHPESEPTLSAWQPSTLLADVSATVRGPDGPGVLQGVDVDHLEQIATDADVTIELIHGVGTAIPGGAPVAFVRGVADVNDAVRDALAIGRERSMSQDPAFGVRQLVDVAVRALSPGTNDPTTARQVVDQLQDLLRRLATRPLGGTRRADANGTIRVIVPGPDWSDYLDLACAEIATYGVDSVQVEQALRGMLDDLLTVVDDDRRAAVERQRERLPAMPGPAG
jgi:uncharacterized membrane protein